MFHRNCGGNLLIQLNDIVSLTGEIFLSREGIKVNRVFINYKENRQDACKIVCESCTKTIDPKMEISIQCNNCGKKIHSINLHTPDKSGGMFCSSCFKYYEARGEKDVFNHDMITKVSLS